MSKTIETGSPLRQEKVLKRDMLLREEKESIERCSKFYSELLDFINTNRELPRYQDFPRMVKNLKPKERKFFQDIFLTMKVRAQENANTFDYEKAINTIKDPFRILIQSKKLKWIIQIQGSPLLV